jgi:undecaprenyl-diphosphatase
MRVFTDVGSFPVVAVVALTAAFLAQRAGRLEAALLLVAGLLAVYVLETLAKGIWDRPRPPERFYDPRGLSFPSGHSAQAITWIAAACVIGRRGLVAAAVVLAMAIGLSRLYLHVHYLTDVLGGFALGTALFAPLLITTRR